ncbi:MAG: UDP-N-acetylglucosamine--N-acetylmuramyl-(pentapeptide) pyrophosphoryl-undecaprenol N-acetylglucosamine transferase [Synergistaceae bacterium]|jgi:UDP-N-acetylglucosamine--N-acetylmuramyl-(pentapeptide) pyrophosphoryl-undecaprenol N-acetylglucosamine transferase|nr:UDP-N-acetylglucosamine--N-acetylmuramyl-(pentapeptide) pyrophosphoryl-undecaprenol N-acetylglucosamine transferase [Synergistaceae bacterium]
MADEAISVKTALIVAGGTGGHIFPALAFGQWLEAEKKANRVVWLSGSRALEVEIYASRGIVPERLPLSGSPLGSSSVVQNFRRWGGLFRAFFQTGKLMRRLRPDICFLFGGYVSLMPLLWCRFLGIPLVMHEQNARAGKVTRLASRMGAPVAAGWDECGGLKGPFTRVGVPVRRLERMEKRDAARALNVDVREDDLVIGVIGGSLSSASLNALPEKLSGASEGETTGVGARRPVFVVLGENGDASASSIRFVGRRWDVTPFYSLVDAVVCRAGASTLAELASYGVPALAIPWKGAVDGHQEANARRFSAMTSNPVWLEGDSFDLDDAFARLLKLCATDGVRRRKGLHDDSASRDLWRLGASRL